MADVPQEKALRAGEPLLRYAPECALPPYTYVPGQTPHPVTDPRGHSYGLKPTPAAAFDPAKWRTCRDYLQGIDLFNHGYYWEAHETWEGLWVAIGRRGPLADFLKGLIKLAASGVKCREGNAQGLQRHLARARTLFQGVRRSIPDGTDRLCGLSLEHLLQACDECSADCRPAGAPAGGTPPRVLAIVLRLEEEGR